MKKLLFLFLITFLVNLDIDAQKKPVSTVSVDTVQVDTVAIDSLCVVIEGDKVCVPTGDAVAAGQALMDFIATREGNLPKSPWGWVLFVLEFLTGATGVIFMARTKKVVAFLKVFFRKKINIVIFIAGLVAAGITLLLGKGMFDSTTFVGIWGIAGLLAVGGYENFVKKPVAK